MTQQVSQQTNRPNVQSLNPVDVLSGVCAELAKLGPLSNLQIRPDSDLASELNIDSLDAITVVLALNSRFGVDLPNVTMDALRTPERIANEIVALLEGRKDAS